MMWTLSGLSDEISADFTEQCEVAGGLGLRYLEVRAFSGPELFTKAWRAITDILTSEGIAFG